MRTEELEERLLDAERVLSQHAKRLKKLEEREIAQAPQPIAPPPSTDYTSHFEELKALFKEHDFSKDALQIYAQINSFRETITRLPKVMPVRHYHHFEDKSRGFIIGGMIYLLTVAVSAGLCFSLFRENGRLQESSIKYEMIRQAHSEAALWADSTYHLSPKEAERSMELVEERKATR